MERVLLAAGTASYDWPDFPPLIEVPRALRAVVGTLRELGFEIVVQPPGFRLDPALAKLRIEVRRAAAAAPVVVVYYTGHGADLERGTYYLVNKESRPATLSESALAARDLLELLTLRDDQGGILADQPTVLVILDCCYSGSAAMTMLGEALRGAGNPNAWVIASAGPLEYAQQGLFAKTFCDAIQRPTTGPSQRFIDPNSIVQAVNDAHAGQAQQQARVFVPAVGSTGIPPFFPNPSYQAGLGGLTVADQQHWLSRLRGGPPESTTGFYFTGKTGRLLAAEHLASWMTDPTPRGLAVVTGSPGTGKSALLALPVLLTERSWRTDLLRVTESASIVQRMASLVPAETPVIAVHARGLNVDQVAAVIARALGRESRTAPALLDDLDARPELNRRVLIVDAVDEAASPATLLGGLVVPMARQPGLRIVAGARRHVLPDSSTADLIIDLDNRDYHDPEALTDYVRRLLTAAEEPGLITPYQAGIADGSDAPTNAAMAVAAAIARQATARDGGPESFLIGRLLALSARSRDEPVDVTKPPPGSTACSSRLAATPSWCHDRWAGNKMVLTEPHTDHRIGASASNWPSRQIGLVRGYPADSSVRWLASPASPIIDHRAGRHAA